MSTNDDMALPASDGEPSEPEPPQQANLILEVVEDGGDWSGLQAVEPMVARLASAIAAAPELINRLQAPVTASVAFSSDASVRSLNARYRHQDKPTNVLSFPAGHSPAAGVGEEPMSLGDIMLADGVVRREASEQAIPFHDHVQHLIVHGVLHLLGYDHLSSAEAEIMEDLERRILASLGIEDPYRESQVSGNDDV